MAAEGGPVCFGEFNLNAEQAAWIVDFRRSVGGGLGLARVRGVSSISHIFGGIRRWVERFAAAASRSEEQHKETVSKRVRLAR